MFGDLDRVSIRAGGKEDRVSDHSGSSEQGSAQAGEADSPHATIRPTVPALEAMLFQAYPLLDHGFVRVIDYMGDDSAIVQAARVSYGRGTKRVQEDEGLIRSTDGEGSRLYTITDAGREHLETRSQEPDPWESTDGEGESALTELGPLVIQIGKAAWQVATVGTPAERTRAVEVLTETRRALYRILAEEPDSSDDSEESEESDV